MKKATKKNLPTLKLDKKIARKFGMKVYMVNFNAVVPVWRPVLLKKFNEAKQL